MNKNVDVFLLKRLQLTVPIGYPAYFLPNFFQSHTRTSQFKPKKEKIVNFQKVFINRAALSCLMLMIFSLAAAAQMTGSTPTVKVSDTHKTWAVAEKNNLYCAGYIQYSAISTGNKIIGANEEADKYNYYENDFMYINMGANKGVSVGDVFAVVRPRGQVKSKWSKKGNLGFYVQEVGVVEVIKVKAEVSVARIKTSCDSFLLGDLVQPAEVRVSPIAETRPALDIFGDPSGKAKGRIIMSRDLAEMPSRDFIVYVDLGADDNVKTGDRLTIFRELGKGNITKKWEKESDSARDYGYESEEYKGGKFSNQTGRKSGDHASGKEVTTMTAKQGRTSGLRKIVGEAVVLNVKEKTATVVITRTASEIHTGDQVEIQ